MVHATDSKGSGCLLKALIGCGGLALLAVLAMVGGCMWMASPGEQIDTDHITGPESLGSAELGDMIEDEGMQKLLETVIQELDEQDRKNLPAWFPRQKRSVSDFGAVLPTSITFTLEDLPGNEDPAIVAAINFRGWVRPFKFAIEQMTESEEGAQSYRGNRILAMGDRAFASFQKGTLLVASTLPALQLVLDRLLDGTTTGARPLPDDALPTGEWDATGGMRNDNGRLDALLASLDDSGEAEALYLGDDATLGFGLDVVDADRARGSVQLRGVTGITPELATAQLQRMIDRFSETFERWDLLVSQEVAIVDGGAVATLELSGLQDAILRGFDFLDLGVTPGEIRIEEVAPPASDPDQPASAEQPVTAIPGS